VARYILGQLRLARGRTAVLAAGLLVAAVSFTLLTSAVTTSQLRVRARVARNFRAPPPARDRSLPDRPPRQPAPRRRLRQPPGHRP
jgi:hypothetical protein